MANPPPPRMPPPPPQPVPAWRLQCGRLVPHALAILTAFAFVQIAFGGLYALGAHEGARILHSEVVVHVVELLILVVAALGFLGRDPWTGAAAVLLFFLLGAQYALIEDTTWLRGLHVANGVIVFAVPLVLLVRRLPPRKAPA